MKSWKISIVAAVAAVMLLAGLGALSAVAISRGSRVAPDCGTPTVNSIPCVVFGHRDESVPLSGSTRIGGLEVRADHWWFMAKVVLSSTLGGPDTVVCTLKAGPHKDTAKVVLPPGQSNTATMTVLHTFSQTGSAIVSCDGSSGESASWLRITALRVGTNFNVPIT